MSDYQTVAIQEQLYELMRFWLLGSCIADQSGRDFYLVNLVCQENEADIEQRFGQHFRTKEGRLFLRRCWESIYSNLKENAAPSSARDLTTYYFENKTIGYNHKGELQAAFEIERWK